MAADPLAELRDIHLPPDPGWWPPAPGWWVMMLSAVVVVVIVARVLQRRRRRARPRRFALRRLEVLGRQLDQGGELDWGAVSVLLRRAALVRYPRHEVAGLAGRDWLEFLDRTGATDLFSSGPGRGLVSAPYARHADADARALLVQVERWIRRNV